MSARELQRVAVRMLHDVSFLEAVYADCEAALEGLTLTLAERASLVVPDRRAWLVDPGRPSRVFEAIRKEYPATCALAEIAERGRDGMLQFFSSPEFHTSVQKRGTLALDFGGWLNGEALKGRFGRKPTAAMALLETACARVRRGPGAQVLSGLLPARLRTSPWLELVLLPEGAFKLFESTRAALEVGRPLRGFRLDGRASEWLLIEAPIEGGGLRIGVVPDGLVALLQAAAQGIEAGELVDRAVALGSDPDEAPGVVEQLYRDALLTEASSLSRTDRGGGRRGQPSRFSPPS